MTELLETLLTQRQPVGSFPVHEYWQDIGQLEDFRAANQVYSSVFS